jgi:hypothetical protein
MQQKFAIGNFELELAISKTTRGHSVWADGGARLARSPVRRARSK